MPSLVGSTDTPGEEILNMESVKLNDFGVIAFGDNGNIFDKLHYFFVDKLFQCHILGPDHLHPILKKN